MRNYQANGGVKPSREKKYGDPPTDVSKQPTIEQLYKNRWGIDEQVWETLYPGMRFIPGMKFHQHVDNGFKKAPES